MVGAQGQGPAPPFRGSHHDFESCWRGHQVLREALSLEVRFGAGLGDLASEGRSFAATHISGLFPNSLAGISGVHTAVIAPARGLSLRTPLPPRGLAAQGSRRCRDLFFNYLSSFRFVQKRGEGSGPASPPPEPEPPPPSASPQRGRWLQAVSLRGPRPTPSP